MNHTNTAKKTFQTLVQRALILIFALTAHHASANGIRLEDWEYPFPEQILELESQEQTLEMVYMDRAPTGKANGESVILLHGKNFSGSYFEQTANHLSDLGYRVIIPDQIGFGKSSKPEHYQYSFQQLALNTKTLLDTLEVESVHVLGHSMGGMVATRFALMYPEITNTLTLLNPIGLEDWKALGVPYRPVEAWYQQELKKTPEKIRSYQLSFYYDGKWKKDYAPWVDQLTSFIDSPDYARMAWNQALTYDMIFTQPVVYEFGQLTMPTLLVIGQRDRTALGKDIVDDELKAKMGDYPKLGRAARKAIPNSKLIELDDLGHLPHIEAFDRFMTPYENFLARHSD